MQDTAALKKKRKPEPPTPIMGGSLPLTDHPWGLPWALLVEGDDEHDVLLLLWCGAPFAVVFPDDPISSLPPAAARSEVLRVAQSVIRRRQDGLTIRHDERALSLTG